MRKTNMCLLLLVLCRVLGQESGSIFDVIDEVEVAVAELLEDEGIDDDTDSSGEPLVDDAVEEVTGADDVTATTTADEDAEDDTVPLGDSSTADDTITDDTTEAVAEETDPEALLIEENDSLLEENEQLELELAEAMSILNQYRIQESELLQEYADEMEILSEFNGVITYIPEPIESLPVEEPIANDDDEDDDDDDDEYMETSLAMIAVIALGFLFLLLHSLRGMWISYTGSEFNQATYTLLIDSTLLVMLWCITAVLDYLDVFDLDISSILVGLALFTFFWLCMGLWLLFMCHRQGDVWKLLERQCLVPGERTPDIQRYTIMRQLFISPVYSASISESQLRPDFNLAGYLCRGLGEVMHTSFHITWVGYSFIVASIILWRMVIVHSHLVEIIVLWSLPGVIFLSILLVIFKLLRVYAALVPSEIKQELQVSATRFLSTQEVRDCIARPRYLRGTIDEDLMRSCICCKINPFKMTCAYLFLNRYPNRHELLFWFDSYGPTFLGILAQALAVLLNFWVTGIIMFYIPIFMDSVEEGAIYLVGLALLVWVVTAFYLIPKMFIYLCLTTKIELMKERRLVEDTIADSRKNIIMGTIKIYRQLKMIYREVKGREEGEEKGQLLQFMKKISEEIFLLVSTNRKTIHVTEIDEVLNLIGIRLHEDELRLFAKECAPDKNNLITLKNFKISIERVLYGFEMKPHEVVKYILAEHFRKKQKINIGDLNEFFGEWSWHFSDDDIREFLIEAQSLADELGYFRHEDVANMIRINVEACPK